MLGMRRFARVVLLMALLAASGCGSDPSLRSLEKDPTATYILPGTHLESEFKDKSGTVLGKPRHAKITRVFSLGTVAPDDAVPAVAAYARSHGWTIDYSRPESFTATKRIDAIRAELLATVSSLGEPETKLYVYLTAF